MICGLIPTGTGVVVDTLNTWGSEQVGRYGGIQTMLDF